MGGLMAIIYNKMGDMGLLLGITLICTVLETVDFLSLFFMTQFVSDIKIQLFYTYFNFLDLVTFFLFLGVIGKSAQIFLESWLDLPITPKNKKNVTKTKKLKYEKNN